MPTHPHETVRSRPGRRRAALAGAAVLALVGAGCSGDAVAERVAEEAIEQAGGGDAQVELDGDGGMAIESSEGTLRTGGGELPASFPDDLPTPPDGYEVLSSFERSGEDGLELQVALMTSGSVDDLVAFYEEALAAAGYEAEVLQRLSQDGLESATVAGRGDEHGVLLQIVADEEGTMVNHSIGPADQSADR